MVRGTTMAPREETIQRLYEERMNLNSHIERLQEQADSAKGGVRMYRNHRVGQFRAREEDLAQRLTRIVSGSVPSESFDAQAEDLAADYREAASLAEHTFQQLVRA